MTTLSDEGFEGLARIQLEGRCESWKRLAMQLENLLVCYRLGSQPSGKLLDSIRRLKDRLEVS